MVTEQARAQETGAGAAFVAEPPAAQRGRLTQALLGRHTGAMADEGDRRAQVVTLLARSQLPLDDDQIAQKIPMNRHYVNAICRRLAAERFITRRPGADGKLVNALVAADEHPLEFTRVVAPAARATPRRASDRTDARVTALVESFADHVLAFEARAAFPGPSVYFHQRAIARRREHATVDSLIVDERFLEYVYAVLPPWGMHRMGLQKAKVGDFEGIVRRLQESRSTLSELWPLEITDLSTEDATSAAGLAWEVIAKLEVSTSRTQIVAGSKFLHHVLPDVLPPIDRQYTFNFFTGQKAVVSDRSAFLTWLPLFADIGRRCRAPIEEAMRRGGFMATGQAKVIDNAIMGFMGRVDRG